MKSNDLGVKKAIIRLKIIKSETLRKWLLTLTVTAQPAILIQWGFVSQTDKTYRKVLQTKGLKWSILIGHAWRVIITCKFLYYFSKYLYLKIVYLQLNKAEISMEILTKSMKKSTKPSKSW